MTLHVKEKNYELSHGGNWNETSNITWKNSTFLGF